MEKKHLRSWKKVFENDLIYIVNELKESVERPSVIILTGEMGAGKTTFAQKMGPEQEVQSPTYSLISEAGNMAYADFYRIEKEDELVHLELDLYSENKDYVLIEWGLPYAETVKKLIGDQFKFFEVTLEVNQTANETDSSSRNYHLHQLDFGW